jgi:hypothetical protein
MTPRKYSSLPSRSRPMPRRETPMKKVRIKPNPKKTAKRLERTHGPKARREWTHTLPCAACGILGYSVAAHVLGNGGMGRKRDASTTAPLCAPHYDGWNGFTFGCHARFDHHRRDFDARFPDFDPERAAAETEKLWQAHLATLPPSRPRRGPQQERT